MEKVYPTHCAQRMHRILVAEDDLTQRMLWARLIEVLAPNSEVFWVDSYAEAASLLESKTLAPESFDLLISDVFLKGTPTGFDICKNYFHQFKGRVILVSSFGDVETPKPFLENFKRTEPIYLKKPLNVREAVSILRSLLSPTA